MKTNLEKYFAKYNKNLASHQLTDDKQVLELLSKADKTALVTKNNLIINWSKIIMNSFITIGIVGFLWLSTNLWNSEQNSEIQKATIDIPSENNSSMFEGSSIVLSENLEKESEFKNDNSSQKANAIKLDYYNEKTNLLTMPLLKLSKSELNALGITIKEKSFTFTNESYYGYATNNDPIHDNNPFAKMSMQFPELSIQDFEEYNYPDLGIVRLNQEIAIGEDKYSLMAYGNWSMTESSILSPTMAYQYYKTIDNLGFLTIAALSPMFNYQEQNHQLIEEMNDFARFINNQLRELSFEQVSDREFVLNFNKTENNYLNRFVTALIVLGDENNYAYTILLYPATDRILNKLSPENQAQIKSYSETMKFDEVRSHFAGKDGSVPLNVKSREGTPGLNELYLTYDELRNIGIVQWEESLAIFNNKEYSTAELGNQTLELLSNLGYDIKHEKIVLLIMFADFTNKGFDNNSTIIAADKDKLDDYVLSEFVPSAMYSSSIECFQDKTTGYFFPNHSMSITTINAKSISDQYPELNLSLGSFIPEDGVAPQFFVPVSFTVGTVTSSDSSKIKYTDYTLWYLISDRFIEKLPIRYQNRLFQELELFNEFKMGLINAVEYCDKVDEPLLDLCAGISDNIEILNVFPMPFEGILNCKINVKQECMFSISLADIKGNTIVEIQNKRNYKTGQHKLEFDLSKLSQGVYLLVFQVDNGESISKRIIKY